MRTLSLGAWREHFTIWGHNAALWFQILLGRQLFVNLYDLLLWHLTPVRRDLRQVVRTNTGLQHGILLFNHRFSRLFLLLVLFYIHFLRAKNHVHLIRLICVQWRHLACKRSTGIAVVTLVKLHIWVILLGARSDHLVHLRILSTITILFTDPTGLLSATRSIFLIKFHL